MFTCVHGLFYFSLCFEGQVSMMEYDRIIVKYYV